VPDRVKPSFVIFDIRALWRSVLSVRVPRCQKFTNDGLTQTGTWAGHTWRSQQQHCKQMCKRWV